MLFKANNLLTFVTALAPWTGHAMDRSTTNVSFSPAIMISDMHDAALQPRTNIGNGIELRIYPLGDSITNGYLSSDDNGYRIGLQRNLAGSHVNFVGSKTSGTMEDVERWLERLHGMFTSSSTATPSEWLLNTIPGTSVDAFQKFIRTLPDGGGGEQIVYDGIDTQGYVAKLTLEEAKVVNRLPIVDQIVSNGPIELHQSSMAMNETLKQLQRRLTAPQIFKEDESDRYKKILSLSKYKDIQSLDDNDHRWDYTFEGTAGVDMGFDLTHPISVHLPSDLAYQPHWLDLFTEFTGVSVETAIFAGTNLAAPNGKSHGTALTTLVAGKSRGVSKRATLVLVKISDVLEDKWAVIYRAWMWANSEVLAKGRSKKAVFRAALVYKT
ncbi:MAG: hypothetical protein Q9228_007754, partial [Teloschistes exilis]